MQKQIKLGSGLIFAFTVLVAVSLFVHAVPSGPTITFISNETKGVSPTRFINTTGGSITTVVLNTTTQDLRWKAYVGNVTGKLTLDDANDNTLFDWTITNIAGEVYSTRSSESINWSGINCSNSTHISMEELSLNHSNRDDNITSTFNSQTHNGFFAGTRQILANTCFSVHTFVNSTRQQSRFEEVALYDSAIQGNGHVVYATPLEQDAYGFDNSTYDFQLIVPENGLPSFSSSTAYYFYVELT